jgi:hypothetical protein
MNDREKAELYDHMHAVAQANGFDSITDAIVDAVKFRRPTTPQLPCPVCGGEAIHAIETLARTIIKARPPRPEPSVPFRKS